MRRLVVLFVVALLLADFAACGDDDSPQVATATSPTGCPTLPTVGGGLQRYGPAVQFGNDYLFVEIADDDAERQTGLMNRTCLEANSGMLFAYAADVQATFWMHNTLVPLAIAFEAADGTILEIEDMAPETDYLHQAPGPYRYAIEANQGWFAEHGIEAGDVAVLPEGLAGS